MSQFDMDTGEVEEINLATLADGAAIEQVNEALKDAWKNIADPNTRAIDKRKVTLELVLAPDEERSTVVTSFRVISKHAACKPVVAIVSLTRARGGEVIATELRSRQMPLRGTVEESPANVTPLRKEEAR